MKMKSAAIAPTEDEINRLEKAAWDANADRALVWYRDQRDQLQWTLDNVYTMARRELNRLEPYATPDTLAIERWGHVLRLCEKAGCQSRGVLRDNGGSVNGD
jgi:hypothetical protein